MQKITKENFKATLEKLYQEDQDACKALELNPDAQFPNNEDFVKYVIDNFGFISPKEYGPELFYKMCVLVQHLEISDDNLKYRLRYLRFMEENKLNPENEDPDLIELFYDYYAIMTDRYLMYSGKKQIYGTQWTIDPITKIKSTYPIDDPENLNKRRKEIYLDPVQVF